MVLDKHVCGDRRSRRVNKRICSSGSTVGRFIHYQFCRRIGCCHFREWKSAVWVLLVFRKYLVYCRKKMGIFGNSICSRPWKYFSRYITVSKPPHHCILSLTPSALATLFKILGCISHDTSPLAMNSFEHGPLPINRNHGFTQKVFRSDLIRKISQVLALRAVSPIAWVEISVFRGRYPWGMKRAYNTMEPLRA